MKEVLKEMYSLPSNDALLTISAGNTPLYRLINYPNIHLKLEFLNESGNHKIRPAMFMIAKAERDGKIKRGTSTLLECSGGSMGASLALISNRLGYRLKVVLPDNYPAWRRMVMENLGAQVELADSGKGNFSHFQLASEIAEKDSDVFFTNQLENHSNPYSHFKSTGPEIFKALPSVDTLVLGIGSGATISGAGHYLKMKNKNIRIVGVQPYGCDSLNGSSVTHLFQGWSLGMVPGVLTKSIVDEMICVKYEEALSLGKELAKSDGLVVGPSSLGNILAAIKYSQITGNEEYNIATICHDDGLPYLLNQ